MFSGDLQVFSISGSGLRFGRFSAFIGSFLCFGSLFEFWSIFRVFGFFGFRSGDWGDRTGGLGTGYISCVLARPIRCFVIVRNVMTSFS